VGHLLQDGVNAAFLRVYPQDGGVSEGFTHKMAAWEICLQDGGVSEFYSQAGGVSEGFTYGNVKKTKTSQKKCKQKQRRIFTTCQDDLLTVDNAQSHVTAFRPISEAARSWSDDKRTLSMHTELRLSHTDHATRHIS